jgi:hypothetical protein
MSDFIGDWHALLILLIAGVIPNQIWRMLGLWLGGGIDEGSELLIWVRAVATATSRRHRANPGAAAGRAGERAGMAALQRGGRGLRGFYGDAAVDLCRRDLRRDRHAERQVVARLSLATRQFGLAPGPASDSVAAT